MYKLKLHFQKYFNYIFYFNFYSLKIIIKAIKFNFMSLILKILFSKFLIPIIIFSIYFLFRLNYFF